MGSDNGRTGFAPIDTGHLNVNVKHTHVHEYIEQGTPVQPDDVEPETPPEEEADQFVVGDVVHLLSGGPEMTVAFIEERGVGCKWFSKNDNYTYIDEPKLAFFHPDMLEMANG